MEESHYYPFGLTMAGISSKALAFGGPQNKEKTFQGQRFDDELGLNWIQFKWRNHDPQIGRFLQIDPLAEKYVYNSTFAFSENKVTRHVELEGLEAVDVHMYAKMGIRQAVEAEGGSEADVKRIQRAFEQGYQKGGELNVKILSKAPIVIIAATQPEIGIPLIIADLTGIPVTPSPQAMSGSALSSVEGAVEESALIGGRKGDIPVSSTLERHEIPSASAMKSGLGIATDDVPAVQLPNSIHNQTGSFGGTTAARNYRKTELTLIQSGQVQEAFNMGVNDLKAIVNSPQGKTLLKVAGLNVKDVNKGLAQMTEYFNSIKK